MKGELEMKSETEEMVIAAKQVILTTENYVEVLHYIERCPRSIEGQLDEMFAFALADSLIFLEDAKINLIKARKRTLLDGVTQE
jgi:uncharacterized membrane protein YcgQ (UPF0703/DUF1980 family)